MNAFDDAVTAADLAAAEAASDLEDAIEARDLINPVGDPSGYAAAQAVVETATREAGLEAKAAAIITAAAALSQGDNGADAAASLAALCVEAAALHVGWIGATGARFVADAADAASTAYAALEGA